MSNARIFDWPDWHHRLALPPDYLAGVMDIFPAILMLRRAPDLAGAEPQVAQLSSRVIKALIAAGRTERPAPELAQRYLDLGELDAAHSLSQDVPDRWHTETIDVTRGAAPKQARAELDYARWATRINQHLRQLIMTEGISPDDKDVLRARYVAEAYFRLRRVGPANRVLEDLDQNLQARLQGQSERMQHKTAVLEQRLSPLGQSAVAIAINAWISEVRGHLQAHEYEEAYALLLKAEDALTKRALPADHSMGERRLVRFRDSFPNVTANEILESLLPEPDLPPAPALRIFQADWQPTHWDTADSLAAASDPLFIALSNLARLNRPGAPFPYSKASADAWRQFFDHFFDLIGQRQCKPQSADALLTRGRDAQSGFWLTTATEGFAIKFTFLNPSRFPNGISVILWHRPNERHGPRPASLHTELHIHGLVNHPSVVISGEPISADDRHALRQVLPAAALLDEHDLLTILFSSEDPEVRALHLARALAWQIPLEWASPFSDQGDVAHAMFVGRETVLSKFLDPQGPTILYGGRKLGKSSIFRQLERAFKEARPGRNVAVYVNAIDIVDGEGIEGHLLPNVMRQINKAVRDLPINDDLTALDVHNSPKTIQCDEFRTRISRLLQALPDHHFLLLVDEADSLLQHLDCANDPLLPASQRFGWSLRALAQESNYRFDIRFAGFQEISRAGQSQSGPFFNFRRGTSNEPLSVLDEPDARILVVRPLQVLGAQFADASLVDLILNFTGRHPALIQDFCRRLYFRVRGPHTREAFRITREDVEAIWQNPDFRKTVVQAIYLNVDTRNTRMEKLMRLVLFLWVQQLMAPAQDFDFPPICEANDLFLLLVRKFGEGPVENQVLLTELDNHLTDLSALGVLERLDHDGIRYSFRYRHFASLLFYDSLSGRLEERVIQALWDSIVHHDNRLPRVQIRTDVGLSMSPFRRDDQQRLERESHRMLLVVGAPGTGKSAYFHWLQDHTQEHARIIVVPSRQRSLPELRILLAEALSLTPPPPSWQAFHDQLSAQDRKWDAPLWIVMDDLDDLAGQDDWPLVTWPDDDTVSHDDGLLQMLGRIEENSRGQLRFFALGTYPLTRLWIDLQTSIQERVDVVATRPLAEREIDGWCESTRLVAVQEVKREIWRLTGGDWRMLSALRAWLKAQALEAPDVDDIRRFAGTLYQSVGDPMFALLRNDIQSYSLTTHAIVSEMVRLTGGKASNATVADWADLLLAPVRDRLSVAAADLTSHQIEIEIKAAVVLGDLALHSDGFQVELPTNGRWLSLLDRHWVHD